MIAKAKPSKREITRAKVITAAIACIHKEGFHAAHTNRIAEQAGVSWGVLQYHFGDKDGLLQAVLDHIFDDFITTLSNTDLNGETLDARVQQLIDAVWALVSQREYRVSIAILRNAGKDQSSTINGRKQIKAWASQMSSLWDDMFADDIRESTMSETARHLMFATLRGLADEINPKAKLSKTAWQAERDALADAITFILRQ
ncbi:MAG: TetR/AcrR family transcriptional regulator [Pseudomonadota bacterium]